MAFGGAASFVAALVGIRPVNRLFFPFYVALVLEVDEVEHLLPMGRRQQPEHSDEISLKARERTPIAKEPLLLLHAGEIKRGLSARSALRSGSPEDKIVQRNAHKLSDRRELVEARALIVPSFDCTISEAEFSLYAVEREPLLFSYALKAFDEFGHRKPPVFSMRRGVEKNLSKTREKRLTPLRTESIMK